MRLRKLKKRNNTHTHVHTHIQHSNTTIGKINIEKGKR